MHYTTYLQSCITRSDDISYILLYKSSTAPTNRFPRHILRGIAYYTFKYINAVYLATLDSFGLKNSNLLRRVSCDKPIDIWCSEV